MSNATDTPTFPGIWLSKYTYHSSVRDADLESQLYIRIFPKGDVLVMETIPETNDSYLHARFTLDGRVATGTWQESTSPDGDYKGATYHGAGQLILSEDGKSFKGKWVGFGKKMEVKTGPWELTYLGEDMSVIQNRAHGQ